MIIFFLFRQDVYLENSGETTHTRVGVGRPFRRAVLLHLRSPKPPDAAGDQDRGDTNSSRSFKQQDPLNFLTALGARYPKLPSTPSSHVLGHYECQQQPSLQCFASVFKYSNKTKGSEGNSSKHAG